MYLSLEKHLAPATVLQASNAVKFLFHQVLNQEDFFFQLMIPRRAQKIPELLTPKEVRQIIQSTNNLKHFAMLSLCYGCGLRLMEVITVQVKNLDSKHNRLKIEDGKGQNKKTVLSQLRAVY